MPPEFEGAIFLKGFLESTEEVVSDERVEAVLAEAVDVGDELGADGEVAGAVEKRVRGGAEAIVAGDDFLE